MYMYTYIYIYTCVYNIVRPPGTEIVFVNDTNYRSLVPDAPEDILIYMYM